MEEVLKRLTINYTGGECHEYENITYIHRDDKNFLTVHDNLGSELVVNLEFVVTYTVIAQEKK